MERTEKCGVVLYRFSLLSGLSGFRHGIFTRLGGVSPPPFNSLNMSGSVGDTRKNAAENRRIVADSIQAHRQVYLNQVHGTDILTIRDGHSDVDGLCAEAMTADALVSDVPGLFLVVQVADCQAVMMVDPVKGVVANVHAGWRGSVGNIVGKTVEVMQQVFGCEPRNILAGIGPSLGPCCGEFIHYRREIPERFWGYRRCENRFDFWAVTQDQLSAKGVLPLHIETAGLCTKCRTDLFFSYRAEAVTGRFGAVIGIDD